MHVSFSIWLVGLNFDPTHTQSYLSLEIRETRRCGNSMKLQKIAQGIVLDVNVRPNSKEFKVSETEEDGLVVFCRETPVRGRVNRELIKELSRLFKRRVHILSGFTSKQKRVLIRDIETNEVRQALNATVVCTRARR